VAAWPKGECSYNVIQKHDEVLFSMPPTEPQLQALRGAAKVVLIRPGDVFLFSGGIAHTVICASEGLSISAYESIISLHPTHVEHLFKTGKQGTFYALENSMPDSELEEVKDDVMDQLEDAADQLSDHGGPRSLPLTSAKAPSSWHKILEDLQLDEGLQKTLCEFYHQAVAICARDCYMQKQMAQRVLRAARACRCGSFASAAAALSGWRYSDESSADSAGAEVQDGDVILPANKRRCQEEHRSPSPESGHSA